MSLQAASPAIDGGTWLTTAINAGSNSTNLTAADAVYFQDGTWGSELALASTGLGGTFQADWIAIASACDVNCDGVVNVADVQLEVNMALGIAPCTNPSGTCTVVSVQRVVNAALGGSCVAP